MTGNGRAFATAASATNGNKKSNTTGRHTLLFRDEATLEGIEYLRNAGFKVFVTNPSDPRMKRDDEIGDNEVKVFSSLGTALVGADSEQVRLLQNATEDPSSPIEDLKPEKIRRRSAQTASTEVGSVAPDVSISLNYLKGRRDTYEELIDKLFDGKTVVRSVTRSDLPGFDETQLTWGLQATKVINSPFSGQGVKVAVLDTGIDFTVNDDGQTTYHADFQGRTIRTASFVSGVSSAKDGDGHGTHCVGVACGPRRPSNLPGYGIAFNSQIYVGKVLDDNGEGADGWILDGIEWAINQGCRIVSMSFGAEKEVGSTFNKLYERVAQRALKAGTLLIAAAGNESRRPEKIMPVNGPADCPSILAVAAVNPSMKVARFSNAGINPGGGEVNIAAPGVAIRSSYLNSGYELLEGTSMATPHVAGIAALFAEANPTATASELQEMLSEAAQKLPFSSQDVGQGMVQAPNGQPVPRRIETRDFRDERNQTSPDVKGGVRKRQTSPITIGGGGSVGLDFDKTHYKLTGPGEYVSTQDKLTTCQVMHQSGKMLRNFHNEIDGKQCRIKIRCLNTATGESEIVIAGAPSGPLGIRLSETAFPPATGDLPAHYSNHPDVKVQSITVENILGGAPSTYSLPLGWKGTIVVDN
jgi:subtilisin family serine protease